MTHSRRNILWAAAGVLCLCCILYAGTQDVFLRPALEAFVDKDTMLVFPAQLDTFQKVRVRKNEKHPVFGTVIRYENEAGSCADVYIYSLDDENARPATQEMAGKHFEETDREIMNMPETKPDPELKLPSNRIRSVVHIEAPGRKAPANGFETYYRIQNGASMMDSILFLAPYSGKIVKVRVSYASEDADEAGSAYRFVDAVAAMLTAGTAETSKTVPAKPESAKPDATPAAEPEAKKPGA